MKDGIQTISGKSSAKKTQIRMTHINRSGFHLLFITTLVLKAMICLDRS